MNSDGALLIDGATYLMAVDTERLGIGHFQHLMKAAPKHNPAQVANDQQTR